MSGWFNCWLKCHANPPYFIHWIGSVRIWCKGNHWYGETTTYEVVCHFLALLHLKALIFSLFRLGGNSPPNSCRAQHSPILPQRCSSWSITETIHLPSQPYQDIQSYFLCIKITSFEYLYMNKAAACRGTARRPWDTHPASAAGALCCLCSGGMAIPALLLKSLTQTSTCSGSWSVLILTVGKTVSLHFGSSSYWHFIPSVTQRQWIFCASHEHSLLPFPLAAELLPAFLFCSITITFFLFQENWTNWPKLGFFSMPWLSLWLMKSKTSLNHIAQFFRMKLPLPIAQ